MRGKERRLVHMRIEAIKVLGRHRTDLGDIASLAASIASLGLLNPITITSDGWLIAGARRVEACRSLGWSLIGCVVADDLDAAVARLRAERDENTERKPMTPAELVSLGMALEELERPLAKGRQGTRTDLGRRPQLSVHVNGKLPPAGAPADAQAGEARQKVASALGISTTTYQRAKAVVLAAADPDASPQERQVAQVALADMNETGNVSGNYAKVRQGRDIRLGARQRPVVGELRMQRHAITSAVATMSGITAGLKRIEQIHPEITREEAAQWVSDLSDVRRVIETLIKRLKEHTHGQA